MMNTARFIMLVGLVLSMALDAAARAQDMGAGDIAPMFSQIIETNPPREPERKGLDTPHQPPEPAPAEPAHPADPEPHRQG